MSAFKESVEFFFEQLRRMTPDTPQKLRAIDRLYGSLAELHSLMASRYTPPTTEPISVWDFEDAPAEFRAMSTNGGDEDYVALLPPGTDKPPIWMEEGSPFGCCSVDVFPHPSLPGYQVVIGSHA